MLPAVEERLGDVIASQAFGAGDMRGARRAIASGLALSLVVTPVLMAGVYALIPLLGVIARNPDFQALARAYGAAAVRAGDATQLTGAIRDAFERQGPTLIEIIATAFAPG